MIDKAAGRLDISACKKNQIIASQSIPIADLQASENNNQGVGAAGRFIPNRDDSCSSYLATDFSFVTGSYTQRLNSGETSINAITSSPYTLGAGGVILTAPGNNNEGSVDVRFRVEDFLRFDWDSDVTTADTDPVNTANFGSYRGNDRIIYRREVSQ